MSTTYAANATVSVAVRATHIRTDEIGPTRDVVDVGIPLQLEGVDLVFRQTVNETDLIYFDEFVDGFGRSVGFAYIKAIYIRNTSTDPLDTVTIGEVNDLPGIPAGIVIPPGGVFLLTMPGDGVPVGPTGSMIITGEQDVSVDIVAIGLAA